MLSTYFELKYLTCEDNGENYVMTSYIVRIVDKIPVSLMTE